ncbi:betaine-aldehyde dehydrogenase [Palleronia abyssalis]|uniref:Betaine-aldehyde dehydrogenase n=1 Tax=Palleronia abyssalis TaxID=1501240 RepID=A0A2R8BTN2_9RHOB|nr:betaine-aldehyde dehydrogenase [Palleronia abyssalis]SPJ23446.1 NAD/NADP-dependent betaine aldehyde dehydrogenase [Palleronia abyssalis]
MTSQQPPASHYIAGAYLDDAEGAAIPVIYPATGQEIARLHAATDAVIDKALAAAHAAQPAWAALSGTERGRILRKAADILRDRNHEMSVLETYDTGKPLSETLIADATSAADALEYFGGLAGALTGEHIQLPEGDFVYTRREALGVVLGIGAWNYPTQIAAWKAAPALACGNTMVMKPSETTPLCTLKLAEILTEAGAPPGVFNVVQGYGPEAAKMLEDPRIAKVSLTGSVPTGLKVYQSAAAGMKHATLELGGKSPLVIFDDADLDSAVSAAINGNFYSTGQICSNSTRVFVQSGIKQAFLDRLTTRMKDVVIGDPLDQATTLGPMVSERQLSITLDYIEKGKAEGARLVTGGERHEQEGFWIAPAVFADVADDMTIAREEIFGPVMSVLDFETEDEVLARANATQFGLAAGVFTQDLTRAHRMAAGFQAGTCYINAFNLTPVEAPFGGMKMSGMGRENSKAAIEHYSQLKSVYVGLNPTEAPF